MKRHLSFLAIAALSALSVVVACSPAQQAAELAAAPAVIDGACVLIHALAGGDQSAQSVCATAEDLAPLVRVLLASRQADASDAGVRKSSVSAPRLVQVAELPVPRGPAPVRCTSWETVAGSGGADGGRAP